MAQAVIMPRQGQSVESCILTEIMKKEGDKVSVGDVLFSCETDKATFEVEAEVEGTLLKWLAEEGDDVPVLENVCIIGEAGEDISGLAGSSDQGGAEEASEAKPEVKAEAEKPAEVSAPAATAQSGDTLKVSPRAKNLAQKQNVDLSKAVPTGPQGRIIERDVASAAAQGFKVTTAAEGAYAGGRQGTGLGGAVTTADLNGPAAVQAPVFTGETFVDEKLSNVRKVIAKSMHASLANMAQLTMNASFDATGLLDFRRQVKESGEAFGLQNITINDMILYAVAKTLKQHRACNAHFLDDKIRYFNTVNLGIAVDTERGLLVPTVFSAEGYSLNDLSIKAKQTIEQAKTGKISPDLLKDGTFTVTNLGALGVESFTPVINPPQTCILGVCAITEKVKIVNGQVTTYPSMGLSLTFDHRAIDGAPAARFLKDLTTNLSNFAMLLV